MLPKWMDKSILASIRTRNRLKKSATNAASLLEYKTYRNKVTFQIRKAKKRFYANLTKENKGDSKMLWNVLMSASNSGTKGSLQPSIKDDSRYVTEPHEIAAMFNLHFSSIADTVFAEAGIQHQDQNYHNEEILDTVNRFVHQRAPTGISPLSIPPVPEGFLSRQIEGLSTNKGIDSLNVKRLKMVRPMIEGSLLYIYNSSISLGIFPHQWKIAKVTPVHKSGPKENIDNYRPISVLSSLSKILERFVSSHLLDHLCKYNLLSECQYGCRPYHSCETLLLRLTDKWLESMDNGYLTGLLLIDFRKAFDHEKNHEILIKKLACYGVEGNVLQWFSSYLKERKQRVSIGSSLSDVLPMLNGVPQGSCLGPLLFLLYVNDISFGNSSTSTHLYVDDTTLHYSSPSVTELNINLQRDANALS